MKVVVEKVNVVIVLMDWFIIEIVVIVSKIKENVENLVLVNIIEEHH